MVAHVARATLPNSQEAAHYQKSSDDCSDESFEDKKNRVRHCHSAPSDNRSSVLYRAVTQRTQHLASFSDQKSKRDSNSYFCYKKKASDVIAISLVL